MSYFSGPNAVEDYLEHKPWTILILNYAPQFYNPEPGIFGPRTSQSNWSTKNLKPAVYIDQQGKIRKILFPTSIAEKSASYICKGSLINEDNSPVDWASAGH